MLLLLLALLSSLLHCLVSCLVGWNDVMLLLCCPEAVCAVGRGEGVVGQTPEIRPNESYSYQSACPLATPRGSFGGWYKFARLDKVLNHYESNYFHVKVAEVQLDAGERRPA